MKQRFLERHSAGWIILIALLAAVSSSSAQTPVEVLSVLRATNVTAAKKTNDTASVTGLPPELTNAIHSINFDRSPEALFDAVRAQQAGGKLTEAERFRLAVLLGDWSHVNTALKTLPAEDAMKAYSRLLESLATNSQSAAQFFQQQQARGSASVTYDQYGNPIPASAPAASSSRTRSYS